MRKTLTKSCKGCIDRRMVGLYNFCNMYMCSVLAFGYGFTFYDQTQV